MIAEMMLAQRLMRGGHGELDVEEDKGFGEAGLMAAMLGLERQQSMQRALDGIGQLLKEQTDLLRGMRDRNQMGPGGGLSSEMALEAFKTLDQDKDGNVTRTELDRHLGLAGQAPGLPQTPGSGSLPAGGLAPVR
ncbi:MAG: hypothetical protein VKP57_00560 [Candidatus Sericytochromatia bacterium]|nr:hypothetical protein [Candidatus Sericytochromatia bacterium]